VPQTCGKSFSAYVVEAFGKLGVERREQVPVQVQRRDRRMTETRLDGLGVRALRDRQRVGRVPQMVESRRGGDAGAASMVDRNFSASPFSRNVRTRSRPLGSRNLACQRPDGALGTQAT
jgi:hypothetical protein